MFLVNFDVVRNNITEANEEEYIARIDTAYRLFTQQWEKPSLDTPKKCNIGWYLMKYMKSS